MNELKIVLNSGDYFYYDTEKTTAKSAFAEFLFVCSKIHINTDNAAFDKVVLRDKEGNDLDKLKL